MALVAVTFVCLGLGAVAVRQNQLAAAQRRYAERLASFNSLLLASAPKGFRRPHNYTTFAASARIGRPPRHVGWSMTLDVPASKSTLPTATLVREVLGYYQLGLRSLGWRAAGSGPVQSILDVRQIHLDDAGAESLILDCEFDTKRKRIKIDALWITEP